MSQWGNLGEPNPYGCMAFCRAPGGAICPRCEPDLFAQFYQGAPK